jgi:uncharacterized membrane protein
VGPLVGKKVVGIELGKVVGNELGKVVGLFSAIAAPMNINMLLINMIFIMILFSIIYNILYNIIL